MKNFIIVESSISNEPEEHTFSNYYRMHFKHHSGNTREYVKTTLICPKCRKNEDFYNHIDIHCKTMKCMNCGVYIKTYGNKIYVWGD